MQFALNKSITHIKLEMGLSHFFIGHGTNHKSPFFFVHICFIIHSSTRSMPCHLTKPTFMNN
ncbi:hypothetical protein [Moraxella lacunata]|uniref:hypothetical protein n=1 Tax=Moraxella lacunata TaxID=477 RepID=UPI003EDEB7D3